MCDKMLYIVVLLSLLLPTTRGQQSGYPQQQIPAGATYNPSGSLPAGVPHGSNPAPGGFPAGGSYYPGAGGIPPGAIFYPPGQVPAGAKFYSQPPPAAIQRGSSGPDLGTGLIVGALEGAILGQVLTTSGSSDSAAPVAAAAANSDGDKDRIIIINNGPVVPAIAVPASGVAPAPGETAAPLAPLAPSTFKNSNAQPFAPGTENSNPTLPSRGEQPPPAGGWICFPIIVLVTEPADATKIKEVQPLACHPAPSKPASVAAAIAPQVEQAAAVQQQENAEIN